MSGLNLAAQVSWETFPQRWYMLTEIEGGFMVFKPCDAENPHITISEDRTEITVGYGQDAGVFTVEEVALDVEPLAHGANHTLTLNVHGAYDENRIVSVDFTEGGMALWAGLPWDEGAYFSSGEEGDDYEVVVQPCRECWGDECDE